MSCSCTIDNNFLYFTENASRTRGGKRLTGLNIVLFEKNAFSKHGNCSCRYVMSGGHGCLSLVRNVMGICKRNNCINVHIDDFLKSPVL